jgi:hypothetical protein
LQSKAAFDEGQMYRVIDKNMGPYPKEVMNPLVDLALSCVDSDTNVRPTMTQVARTLDNLMVAYKIHGGGLSDIGSLDISMDDLSVPTRKGEKLDGNSTSTDSGFDTGSSQNTSYTNVPASNDFLSGKANGNFAPR